MSSAESEWAEFDRLHVIADHKSDREDQARKESERAWKALYKQRAKAQAAGPRPVETSS